MLFRKNKKQQEDSEKLQELLQAWEIQLPEKEKKSGFPETSLNDFPKADFPESESKLNSRPEASPVILKKETPEQKKISVPENAGQTDFEKEQHFRAVFREYREKQTEKKDLHTCLMDIGDPELDKKFRREAIQYMHGTVRIYSPEFFILLTVLVLFGLSVMYQIFTCFSVLAFAAAAFLLWYASRWKLTFDGSTNRFSYQSLTCQEIYFHASEIESIRTENSFHIFQKILILSVHGQEIRVALGFPQNASAGNQEAYSGGYYQAHKLQEYLDFYQSLHGDFSYSPVQAVTVRKKSDTSSKEELMKLLAQYQKQIDEKRQNQRE